MKKTIIYLTNLTHVNAEGRPSTDSIPLNIGFLKTYLDKNLKSQVQIELFNLPAKLEDALNRKIPHIFAASNYCWNANLNYSYLSYAKNQNPQTVTIMGGPNYPGKENLQKAFFNKHKDLDFYIFEEGETSLLSLVHTLIENNFNIEAAKQKRIEGCHCLLNNTFINGGLGKRITNLNDIPSPYLKGLFNRMLRDGFVPVIQSNRGCPFSCAYCHSSLKYYNKIYKFDYFRVCDEIKYIAGRANTKYLFITDDNFGMFKEDTQIAKTISACREKYNWPLQTCIATSKTRKDRVLSSVIELGDTVYFSAAAQSHNEKTLKAISRQNLPFENYKEIIERIKQNNATSLCELILGLPEETRESHLLGIKVSLDADIDMLGLYTCMLLKNTPLAEDAYFDNYQMIRKFRVIPRDFGIYLNQKTIEIEEVCVATKDLSFEDYIFLRGFHFVIAGFYNFNIFKEIVYYLKYLNVSIYDWLSKIHEQIRKDKGQAGDIYKQFIRDTKAELWDSEEEILQYYQKAGIFQRLLEGIDGANLLQKYSSIIIDNLFPFIELASNVIIKNYKIVNKSVVQNLAKYCLNKRGNIFEEFSEGKTELFDFDLLKWIKGGMKRDVEDFAGKTSLFFSLNKRQKKNLRNYLEFYGRKNDSKGKILTRINFDLLYKNCTYALRKNKNDNYISG